MEGLAKLGIIWQVLISQAISFLILFVALIFVAYKPIVKMLDERSKRIKESLEQAEIVKEQSKHAGDEVQKQLKAASLQGQEMIDRATKASDEIRAKAQDLARKDAEVLIEKARQAIKAERDEAIYDLRKEFADVTILAASKVIGESLDKESHKKLIDKILQENQTLNKG